MILGMDPLFSGQESKALLSFYQSPSGQDLLISSEISSSSSIPILSKAVLIVFLQRWNFNALFLITPMEDILQDWFLDAQCRWGLKILHYIFYSFYISCNILRYLQNIIETTEYFRLTRDDWIGKERSSERSKITTLLFIPGN